MCREQLPVWQKFYQAHRNQDFEILAIAMDAQGADVARRYTEEAGAEFATAVDRTQGLWQLYGFDVVPNGFFVDERGVLRYMKVGGIEVRNLDDAAAIESLLAVAPAKEPAASHAVPAFSTIDESLREAQQALARDPSNLDLLFTVAERHLESRQYIQARGEFESLLSRNSRSARALVGLAAVQLALGEREKAAAALKNARAIEPDNWIIRKQIWAVEHPEQFYPAINPDWQREQIRKEDRK